jgi:phosphatidylglycerophosphate synthase
MQKNKFALPITFSGTVRVLSFLILIYIIDFVLGLKNYDIKTKWNIIIIFGGIEILFFFSITKVINLLLKLNKHFENK